MVPFINSFRFQIIAPFILVMSIILLVLTFYIPFQAEKNVSENTLHTAITSLEQFKILRRYYADNVVKKVHKNGTLQVDIIHLNNPNTIPLPATMIHDLSKLFGEDYKKFRLYSPFPFPNQKDRTLDTFEQAAWETFQHEPNKIIQQQSTIAGRTILRVAISDQMQVRACVDCHNSHPLTPKKDWQLGDVRGVLEANIDITDQLELANILSMRIVSAIIFASITLIIIFFFLTRNITKQISNISNAMINIGHGDYDTEIMPYSGTKEVDQMAKAFQLFKDALIDRQRLEKQKQLFEEDKITSLGTMVSGIAHEITTPIGVGVTATSYLQDQVENLEKKLTSAKLTKSYMEHFIKKSHDSLAILDRNLSSAANLITSFKEVSVDQVSEAQREVYLSEYMQSIILSLKPKIKESGTDINIENTDDYKCLIYPGALSQVMTNLIMNSIIHGFENIKNGVINIRTSASKNGGINIIYSDNGVGISNKIIGKVMDPFFTTKRNEGGSGLGLSIIHNIITKQFHGTLTIDNTVEKGIVFEINFNSLERLPSEVNA